MLIAHAQKFTARQSAQYGSVAESQLVIRWKEKLQGSCTVYAAPTYQRWWRTSRWLSGLGFYPRTESLTICRVDKIGARYCRKDVQSLF